MYLERYLAITRGESNHRAMFHNFATLKWRIAAMINRRIFIASLAAPLTFQNHAFSEPLKWQDRLIAAAGEQIGVTVHYDPNYTSMQYPAGDVPIERGVCTDVIIRAYRTGLKIDLQKFVHEDMVKNFSAYPTRWGLKKPDSNIDHRRVPNLQTFFKRQKSEVTTTDRAHDYEAGDLISMMLPGNLPHIALVTHYQNADKSRPLCIHNIGGGVKLEDVLFAFPLTGHYRYAG
jgi:uncharacterized protein